MMSLKNIKICGITTKETLDACIDVGVGFIGFNFVPQSSRFISVVDAERLADNMPSTIAKVALVVNETDIVLETIIKQLEPDYIQLHGTETLQRVLEIKQKFNIKIIKAVGVANNDDIDNAKIYFNHVDMMLFDAKPIHQHPSDLTGGHGQQFDWSLLNHLDILNTPFMLAGGLNHGNLQRAKAQTNATYFDICSGVEESKGIKSIALITELKKLSSDF